MKRLSPSLWYVPRTSSDCEGADGHWIQRVPCFLGDGKPAVPSYAIFGSDPTAMRGIEKIAEYATLKEAQAEVVRWHIRDAQSPY